MEALRSSELYVSIYQMTRLNIPESLYSSDSLYAFLNMIFCKFFRFFILNFYYT